MAMILLLLIIMKSSSVLSHFLPIVDLAEVAQLSQNTSTTDAEMLFTRKGQEMGRALSTFGFLYLTGHGIPSHLIKESFQASRDFFINHSTVHHQYRRRNGVLLGYVDGLNERDFPERPPDLKQAYDVVKGSPEFEAIPRKEKSVMSQLWGSFRKASDMILRLMAASTNQPRNHFTKAHQHVGEIEENTSTMRLLYYPKVNTPVLNNQSRISEHTDFGTFTMLLQDNVGGLEVLDSNGNYKAVSPITDAIVLNVGDLLQLWSNNYFRSTVHRVVPKQTNPVPRQSIAFFTNPDNSFVINSLYGRKSVLDHMNERNEATVFDN